MHVLCGCCEAVPEGLQHWRSIHGCIAVMRASKKKLEVEALCAGKGKDEETVQEEGGASLNGRGTDEVQAPSDEVHLCTLLSNLTPMAYSHALSAPSMELARRQMGVFKLSASSTWSEELSDGGAMCRQLLWMMCPCCGLLPGQEQLPA